MKNHIVSIQARLRNLAQADGKNYQLILVRYFQERLIYRLSVSNYCDHFCLKGGALLYALAQNTSRPTLDIDFLGVKISSEQSYLKHIFTEICQKAIEQDGVIFNVESLVTSEIAKEGKYSGVRIKIEAFLGNIRQTLQIDIGFGDVVIPKPVFMVYPTLLAMNPPHIWAYSIESIIAEKFEAMIDLAETNSRMKDFYDIFHLLQANTVQKDTLKKAIVETFKNRRTETQFPHPIFSADFAQNERRLIQWQAFLRKSKLEQIIDFQEVMKLISEHLLPIYVDLIR